MKSTLLNCLLTPVAGSRFPDVLQRFSNNSCTVLLYHSVGYEGDNISLGKNAFQSHADVLKDEFNVIGADEFLWHRRKNKKFPRRSVLITFDDGFRNNYTVVHPILKERNLPWVLFTTTQSLEDDQAMIWTSMLRAVCFFTPPQEISLLGRTWFLQGNRRMRLRAYKDMNRWVLRRPYKESRSAVYRLVNTHWHHVPEAYVKERCALINRSQLRELVESGVEIGAHTRSHPFLPVLSEEELTQEIDEATGVLADLAKTKVRMFAYPSGGYGRREVERMSALGFECAFAVIPTLGESPQYEIPRTGIYGPGLPSLRAKSLGFVEVLRQVGIKRG